MLITIMLFNSMKDFQPMHHIIWSISGHAPYDMNVKYKDGIMYGTEKVDTHGCLENKTFCL